MLVPTNERKQNMENFRVKSEIWLGQPLKAWMIMMKNMKIKFNLDDKLPLNKIIEIPSMLIVIIEIIALFLKKILSTIFFKWMFV